MERDSNQKGDELGAIERLLSPLGFTLDVHQPFMSGERFLMEGGKRVLAGTRVSDGLPVVIKASRHADGRLEIESEKKARDLMQSLPFADRSIALPEELYFGHEGGYVFLIMRFISQERVFAARPLTEQFFIALNAFEAQESFHATTFEHMRAVKKVFPVLSSREYIDHAEQLRAAIVARRPALEPMLAEATASIAAGRDTIDRHAGYLTHTDFVPHNFRLNGHTLYMLDCVPSWTTIHFGNKYEGWARFLNYMALHSPGLEVLLTRYIRENRSHDEYTALRLMRAYKILFLLDYYTRALQNTTGDLHELTERRIEFWSEMLMAVLADTALPQNVRELYVSARDRLRSAEEKERQRDFAIA